MCDIMEVDITEFRVYWVPFELALEYVTCVIKCGPFWHWINAFLVFPLNLLARDIGGWVHGLRMFCVTKNGLQQSPGFLHAVFFPFC